MKLFATLATILGVAYATPEAKTYSPNQVGSMRSDLQKHNNVMGMSNMRMTSPYQAQAGPRQYHLQDEFGNFEYAYANQDSEKMEKGNDKSVRGRYAYIMSDGVLRRVDYIADNNGFHILQDSADNSRSHDRIKRSVEPDLTQTRMTSFMDSSSLRDNSMVNPNMYKMMQNNRMNQMSSKHNMNAMMNRSSNIRDKNMRDNIMSHNKMDDMMGRDMYSNTINRNMIGQDMASKMGNHNMMGQEMMAENMLGRNVMGNNVYNNMMGRDMSSNLMNRNMMGQAMVSNMGNRNMMGQQMMEENILGGNMMGNNLYTNMMGRDMSSNLGQRNTMGQRMEIEQIPTTIASRNPFF